MLSSAIVYKYQSHPIRSLDFGADRLSRVGISCDNKTNKVFLYDLDKAPSMSSNGCTKRANYIEDRDCSAMAQVKLNKNICVVASRDGVLKAYDFSAHNHSKSNPIVQTALSSRN